MPPRRWKELHLLARMDFLAFERRGEHNGLSLGWLLILALGGGILLFAAIGLLLSWRLKARPKRSSMRVYATPAEDGFEGDPTMTSSTSRLLKRRFKKSQSSLGQFSRRLSLTNLQAPVLPPLPTYTGGGRRVSRNWLDENAIHGPKVNPLGFRDSWFGRDSWIKLLPTLPNLDSHEPDKGGEELQDHPNHRADHGQNGHHLRQHSPQKQNQIHHSEYAQFKYPSEEQDQERHQNVLQLKSTRPSLRTSQTAPELYKSDESPRGRSRAPAHSRPMAPFGTEAGLRDILQLTEQRLREGNSRSPTKTNKSSPTKVSPVKTPTNKRSPNKSVPVKYSPTKATPTKSAMKNVSPVKSTPKASPSKSTPSKTPQSFRTAPLSPIRRTPSPTKRSANASATPTKTKTHSRNASVTSISSADNSLINMAAQELDQELEGGLSSPSRPRGRSDVARQDEQRINMPKRQQPQQQQTPQAQQQRRRSSSAGSSASSSLSTLYSVGEPEDEERHRASRHNDDPFVETGRKEPVNVLSRANSHVSWEPRQHPTGPRPLRRTKTTLSAASLPDHADQSAVPKPLRTISPNSRLGQAVGKDGANLKANSRRFSLLLQAPSTKAMPQKDPVRPTSAVPAPPGQGRIPESSSEASLVSVSVHTEETAMLSREGSETPKKEEVRGRQSGSGDGWRTPTGTDELSSSPINEKELLSMLLMGGGRKRDLPQPPTRVIVNDHSSPTALSPRPKSRGKQLEQAVEDSDDDFPAKLAPKYRRLSTSSSDYDQQSFFSITADDSVADLPARNLNVTGAVSLGTQAVGNTVVELRRMNSLVSSYSVASIGSTFHEARGGDAPVDSPTLQSLRGGGFAPSRSNSNNALTAGRNYLSLSTTSPKSRSSMQKPEQHQPESQRVPPPAVPAMSIWRDRGSGKENEKVNVGLGVQGMSLPGSPQNNAGARNNLTVPPASQLRSNVSSAADESPARTNQAKRESGSSLGLYDKDGFLLNSPERDALAKGGQLRM